MCSCTTHATLGTCHLLCLLPHCLPHPGILPAHHRPHFPSRWSATQGLTEWLFMCVVPTVYIITHCFYLPPDKHYPGICLPAYRTHAPVDATHPMHSSTWEYGSLHPHTVPARWDSLLLNYLPAQGPELLTCWRLLPHSTTFVIVPVQDLPFPVCHAALDTTTLPLRTFFPDLPLEGQDPIAALLCWAWWSPFRTCIHTVVDPSHNPSPMDTCEPLHYQFGQ